MEGDSRNPRVSLLKKFDIPVEHLSYEYVEKCSNKKELEKIIRILRSGEEGSYPDLLKVTEERLRLFAPESRVLRVETPVLTKDNFTKDEWDAVEKELLVWEEEMNIMDKSLDFEKGRIETVGNKNLPNIRKMIDPKPKEGQTQSKQVSSENNKRIKSGDYSAWDKFDVERELLKIDVDEEQKQEEIEKKKREAKKLNKSKKIEIVDVDKENYSSMEQQILANQAKDRGNECYKSGDLENALKYYEISIRLCSTVYAYNNRAMTYLKLKQYNNAVNDCNKVLQMEKNNVKALLRRATAYQNMPIKKDSTDYNQLALQDLYEIIKLEPNNKVAQADIQKLKKKLNIEDTGKKFRMPISEELVIKGSSGQTEGKNSVQNSEYNMPVHKLPLTYYGPSTSTFQCEPYSMLHRALSGSSIPGHVLCKCNSSRTRQNPLCQKCGEAMSTPKSIKTSKTKKELKSNTKTGSQTNKESSEQLKKNFTEADINSSSDVSERKSEISNGAEKENILTLNPVSEGKENHLQENTQPVLLENKKGSRNKNNLGAVTDLDIKNLNVNKCASKDAENSLTHKSSPNLKNKDNYDNVERITEPASGEATTLHNEKVDNNECVGNEQKASTITESSSGQDDNHHKGKKSKNRKKKLKDKDNKILRKHLEPLKIEPVKVIHADKYLHPTSVEPKIKIESSENQPQLLNLSNNIQYKDFTPNRKYHSSEYRTDSSATIIPSTSKKQRSPDQDIKNSSDMFLEGNKENILERNSCCNIENNEKEGRSEETKREAVDSAYEFMRTWEELKKLDDTYIKRAEIIRMIKPSDLSKVIGIELDSEMLSCLLECLSRHLVETDPQRVIELLKHLPQIPRFGLVSMFLAETDKKKMKKLIETAENKGFKLDEDIKKTLTMPS